MTQQIINIGAAPNDGQGTPLRTSFQYCDENFTELYNRAQTTTPLTLVGSPGDVQGMYAYDSTYFYYCFADYDGSSIIWAEITNTGNVAATQILNGTSSIVIASPGANATVSINGTSNVAVFNSGGANITGNLTTTGNVTGTYFLGDGSQLTGIPSSYTNSNVSTYLASGTNSNNIITTGNVSGTYIIGDGSLLTNISGGSGNYTNANVAAYLPTYTGNLQSGNLNVINTFNIGGTPFTRTLTVGTRSTPVTVPLASNNSFNVVGRTGNVVVTTT
jgi:hypothetical protein